jgi:hypothetical protein
MTSITTFLRRARVRIVSHQALVWTARGAAAAALAGLGLEVAFRRWPVDPAWPALAAAGIFGLLIATGGWLRAWPSRTQVARVADAALGSRDRIATALEFATAEGYLPGRQRYDAERFALAADPRRVVTAGWPRPELLVALVAAALATWLALTPNPALNHLRQSRSDVAAQEKAAEQIEQIVKAVQTPRPGEDPAQKQQLVQELKNAADAVRKAPDPASATAALSQAQDQIKALQDPGLQNKQDGAAAAGQPLAGSTDPSAQKAGQALANGDNRAASDAMKKLGDSLNAMTPADQAALAQQLAQAAQNAQSGNPQLGNALQKAADALKRGDTSAAASALAQAAAASDQLAGSQDFQGDLAQAVNGIQAAKGPLVEQAQQGGQPGQSGQPGQPGQGSQPGQGNQNGSGTQPGPGTQPGSGGTGSTSGSSAGSGTSSGGLGVGSGGGSTGSKPFNPSEKVYVQGQTTAGSTTRDNTKPGDFGPGTQGGLVDADTVYANYRAAALSQVDRQLLSEQERQLVAKYFSDSGR